jgi:HEPN domain-containing protein
MREKTDIIKLWIEKGDHDLGTAIITHKHIPKYSDTIAFHCQQAVEKYLKSYCVHLGIKIPRTHDLIYLLEVINQKEDIQKNWFDKLLILEDFAVEIRYPDQSIKLAEEEIKEAISIAKMVRTEIAQKLDLAFDIDGLDN